jgi:hypothetical protein
MARLENMGQEEPFADWVAALRAPRLGPNGENFWHVGTDGVLPWDLPDDIRIGFRLALARAEAMVCGSSPLRDNEPLMMATWCFTACPETVQDALVDAWEAHQGGKSIASCKQPQRSRS